MGNEEPNAAGTPLAESVPRLDHSSPTDPFNTEGPRLRVERTRTN